MAKPKPKKTNKTKGRKKQTATGYMGKTQVQITAGGGG